MVASSPTLASMVQMRFDSVERRLHAADAFAYHPIRTLHWRAQEIRWKTSAATTAAAATAPAPPSRSPGRGASLQQNDRLLARMMTTQKTMPVRWPSSSSDSALQKHTTQDQSCLQRKPGSISPNLNAGKPQRKRST